MENLEVNENKTYSITDKSLLVEDVENAGLKRVVINRNSFFRDEDFVEYIKNVKDLKICGAILGFLSANEPLVETIKNNIKSGGKVEFLMIQPNSKIAEHCKKEEQWYGKYDEIVNASIKKLLEIKEEFPDSVRVYLFGGAMYNTFVSADDTIIVSPYVFGKRGWYAPTLIFSRKNSTVISAFDDQLEEMKRYGEDNLGALIEIENQNDLKIFNLWV